MLDDAELATQQIIDDDVPAIEATEAGLGELVTLSRQLHYLLSLITKDSARLVAQGRKGIRASKDWK